jgi:thiamine kinase
MPETDRHINSLLVSVGPLRGAQVVKALAGGPASDSWLLKLHDELLVARVDQPVARALGLNRHAEAAILQVVSEAGIGPQLVWSDPDQGVQVCRYIDGDSWNKAATSNPECLRQLAITLKKLHQLPPVGHPFEPAAAALRYAAEIGTATAEQLAERSLELAAGLQLESGRKALCHNDLVHSNIIGQDPVYLIDWEYAAVGDPYFDLAVVIQHHQLTEPLTEFFLQSYAAEWQAEQLTRLDGFCELYDHLAGLWYLSMVARFGPDSSFVDDLNRIMLRLEEPGSNP